MTDNASRLKRSPALWALYVLLGLFAFVQNMIGPAVPFLRKEFDLDYSTAALHMSAFALGQMVSGLLAPKVIQRLGLRRAIWLGILGIFIGLTGLILAPVPAVSLVSILVMSLTGTLTLSGTQASVSMLSGDRRGQALMEANIAASVTSAAAPFVLIAGVALGIGWRALWPAFVIAAIITTLLGFKPLLQALPAQKPSQEQGAAKQGSGLPASFWKPWILIFVGVGVEWSVGFWATEYMKGLPGHSVSLAAAGAGVFQIAAVFSRLTSSRLIGRFGERKIIIAAMCIVALGFPLYWLRSDAITAFLGLALCGLGVSTFYPIALSLSISASGGHMATASSFAAVASGGAIFAMPLVLGLVADRSGLPTALFAIPIGLALMVLLLIRKPGRASRV